jgi:hypothetical protein
MQGLKRLAFNDCPLQFFYALSQIHVWQIKVYQLIVIINQTSQLRNEVQGVLVVLLMRQGVATQIKRLDLRVELGYSEHDFAKLLWQEALIRQVQFTKLRQLVDALRQLFD